MPNKAEWCPNRRVHLEHVERIEGQVVICDGLPPHPDVQMVIEEQLEEHVEDTDYDNMSYVPPHCYGCGRIDSQQTFEQHIAQKTAEAVLDRLRPFLNFPLDDGDDIFPMVG